MALEDVGVNFIANGGDVYITTVNHATKATDGFVSATEQGSSRISGAGQVMIGAMRQIGAVAVDMFGKAAQATAQFLTDSVDKAGDFQAGMLEFQAVAGKDVDAKGLEKFHDLFLQLGKDLPVSTADVQQAAIEMTKGGIDPATIAAGGLKQNIQFAAAAMKGDLVGAAEISSKILGGWADINATAAQKADFLTHSTDVLTKAANASSVDVHELSLGIFNAQGAAKVAGVSFDDLTTTLAELSPRFASSSEAGNSLKNVIARLQPTTKPAIAAMRGLGLITEDGGNKFYDAQGQFIGFQKASQVLQDSLAGLTNQQKQSVLQTIFGNDAMNAAAGLAELGSAGYQKMADALAQANGVQENAALKQQGYNVALDNAKGSVEALQITLGEKLLPVLTDLLNTYIAPGINAITAFADSLFSTSIPIQTIGGLISGANVTIADMNGLITSLSSAFGITTNQSAQLVGAVGSVGDAFTTARAGAQVALDLLQGHAQMVFGTLEQYIPAVMAVIGEVVDAVTKQMAIFWEAHGDEIMSFAEETWKTIEDIYNTYLKLVFEIVIGVLKAVADFINAHGKEIQTILSGAWQIISNVIKGALAIIQGVLKVALDIMHGDWQKAWDDIKQMVSTVWESVKGIISGALDIIAGFFGTSLKGLYDTWAHNWEQIKLFVTSIDWTALGVSIIDGITGGLLSKASALYSTVSDIINSALGSGEKAADAHSPARKFIPLGRSMMAGVAVGAEEGAPWVTGAIARAVSPAANAMQIAGAMRGGSTTYNQQRTLNMPVYTNMTQGAIQQSAAIARALLT